MKPRALFFNVEGLMSLIDESEILQTGIDEDDLSGNPVLRIPPMLYLSMLNERNSCMVRIPKIHRCLQWI